LAAEHQRPSAGGERKFISNPPLPTIFKNALIPTIGSIDPPHPLFYLFIPVPPYVGVNNIEKLLPSSPTNGERWITTGPFALVHRTGRLLVSFLRGFPMRCSKMDATSRSRA
jgi:hypothetical protein